MGIDAELAKEMEKMKVERSMLMEELARHRDSMAGTLPSEIGNGGTLVVKKGLWTRIRQKISAMFCNE